MDLSSLHSSSRLLVISRDDYSIRVADVDALTFTDCNPDYTFPVPAEECPADRMPVVGLRVVGISALLIISLGVLASCGPLRLRDWSVDDRRYPGVKWPGVAFFWLVDFWNAVRVSMYAQTLAHTPIMKIEMGLVLTLLYWDLPLACFQYCLRGRCRCAALIGVVWGILQLLQAGALAYVPHQVAILGHHPMMFGLVNVALSIPKTMVKTRVQEYMKQRVGLSAAPKTTDQARAEEMRGRFLDVLINPVKPFYPEPSPALSAPLLAA